MTTPKLTPFDRTVIYGCLVFLTAGISLIFDGCAPGIADTYASLNVQERALKLASLSLLDASLTLEQKCVEDASERHDVDMCKQRVRAKVDVAIKSIVAAQAATVTAKDMLQGVAAASKAPKSVMSWVSIAVRAYVDVSAALAQLGIALGG